MQALILVLAAMTQAPASLPTSQALTSTPQQSSPTKTIPQAQPPVKTLPTPQAPAKLIPQAQPPVKTLPTPQAPTKTPPPLQPPAKTLPTPQAPAKLLPQEQPIPTSQSHITAQEEVLGPDQQVWIPEYGGYCVGQQVIHGSPECVGKWRIKYKVSTPDGNYTYTAHGYGSQSYTTAQAGFLNWLNSTRATYGLPAVGYDSNLEAWASQNNAEQSRRGLGHHIMGPARRQNSAMSSTDPGNMWMASDGHRSALLDPTISAIGLAFNGLFWTFNAY